MTIKSRNARYHKLTSAWFDRLPACTVEIGKQYLADYPKDGAAWLFYGIALTEVARYEEARRAFEKAIKFEPPQNLHYVYSQMGRMYDQKGDLRRAAVWFKKCAELHPEDATYLIYLGSVLARQGNLREAELCHRKATKCKQGCIDEAYLNLGLLLRAQGLYREAEKCFMKALDIDPKYRAAKAALKDIKKVMDLQLEL
jgi:tetratricopeptide (TPR) repeat protein